MVTERDALKIIQACPRFEQCGAPLCPLDPRLLHRRQLPGEAVCRYLPFLRRPVPVPSGDVGVKILAGIQAHRERFEAAVEGLAVDPGSDEAV